ncbi:MAG: YdcF family protein [Deferrisomatales bacterium]|nr:YdcF family protein [Deferrisomatales bacterium]
MPFEVIKLLTAVGMPLAVACWLLVLGFLLSWRAPWTSRFFLLLALGLLAALGSGAVAQRLVVPLERAFPVPARDSRAEAAVVLAGTVDLARSSLERVEFHDRPERIIEGARLVLEGRARWLVISGGSGDPSLPGASEAELLGAFARQMGVDPGVILLQEESRTTHEDAELTAALLRERGIGRFFLVTSAFHLPRAVGCFRKAGLEPIPYPVDYRATPLRRTPLDYVPQVWALQLSTLAVHEYLGYAGYRLLGYL